MSIFSVHGISRRATHNVAPATTTAPVKAGQESIWTHKILLVSAILIILLGAILSVPSWIWDIQNVHPSENLILGTDTDLCLIIGGVSSVHTVAETERWWHGTWAGQVPFWRPLTSLVFWGEHKLFGQQFGYWLQVSVVLQLIICGLFLLFTSRLTRSIWFGLAATFYFTAWRMPIQVGMSEFLTPAPASIATQSPKDQPELLVSAFVLLALITALSRKWGWVILAGAIATCFKESGWLTFPLVLSLIIWRDGARSIWTIPTKWWLALGLTVTILIVARVAAGPEVFWGYRLGDNKAWLLRFINALGYFPLNNLLMPVNAGSVLLSIAGLIAISRLQRMAKLSLASTTLILAIAVHMLLNQEGGFEVALTQLLALNWHIAVVSIPHLVPIIALAQCRQNWRLALLFGGMMILSALPYAAASQVTRHALFMMYLFQSALVVVAWRSVLNKKSRVSYEI